MSTCSPVYWYGPGVNPSTRDRFCLKGVCSFYESINNATNVSTSLSIEIIPYVAYVYNNSGNLTYVSNCEEQTNGFTLRTNRPVLAWYYYTDSGHTPTVPASTENIDFGQGYTSEYKSLLPALCEIPAGSEYLYGKETFQLYEGDKYYSRVVYSMTFRTAYKVNASLVPGSGIKTLKIETTRPGTCYYRTANNAWTNASSAPASVFYVTNLSSVFTYEIKCNNSYGETATTQYTSSSGTREIFVMVYDYVIAAALAEVWIVLVGSPFVWNAWYILIIFIVVLFIAPLLYLVISRSRRSRAPSIRERGGSMR